MNFQETGTAKVESVNKRDIEIYAILDGSNVSYSRNDGRARLSDIMTVRNKLLEKYERTEIIVDASLRHSIDNQEELEKHVKRGTIIICPAGIDGDDLIWERATSLTEKGYDVTIVSNDWFPVKRAKEDGTLITNYVVSIFPDGDVHLLQRKIDYFKKQRQRQESNVRLINIEQR